MTISSLSPSMAFLTPEGLAQTLSIPQRTIDDWRYRGVGPTWLRIGKHVRYRMSDVEDWLRSKEERTAA